MPGDNQIINEFGITFCTVNGSGSATANNTIQKAIFKMGIPVAARNIFPSNIQGMPTWYSLRVSEKSFKGRLEKDHIVVCMNPETADKDAENLNKDGILLINKNIKLSKVCPDKKIITMPVDDLLSTSEAPGALKPYLANMVYVGFIAWLIEIDMKKIEEALGQHFNGKKSAIDTNMKVVTTAYQWAKDNIEQIDSFKLVKRDAFEKKIMIDGNSAGALGALFGGLQFAAWYPITPATSLAETLNDYIPEIRRKPNSDEITCAVVQAEDELAAIGMVVGAGWAGLRSMTSTSGPGLCLMAEFIGLAYFTETPLVVWDVQRVGPSTGMPTHTSQGDLAFSFYISHGDKDLAILLPGNMNECFEFGWKSLDIAEQIQSPVIILSDLELGMNIWMADDFEFPDTPIKRGKILWEKELDQLIQSSGKAWGRFVDIDGDGIPYRTVVGNKHKNAPYFTRGTSHDPFAAYSESSVDWEENLLRLKRKFENSKYLLPKPVFQYKNQKNAIITFGSSWMPVEESLDLLSDNDHQMDFMRIRAIPFNEDVEDFIKTHERIFVVENNRDGQMTQILSAKFPIFASKFISIARSDGLSLSAEWIFKNISRKIEE